jgi:hypothetical protein
VIPSTFGISGLSVRCAVPGGVERSIWARSTGRAGSVSAIPDSHYRTLKNSPGATASAPIIVIIGPSNRALGPGLSRAESHAATSSHGGVGAWGSVQPAVPIAMSRPIAASG